MRSKRSLWIGKERMANPQASKSPFSWLRANSVLHWESITSSWRADPDFMVIGAQRAGTTSLFAGLCDHPQVLAPRQKELHRLDQKNRSAWNARVGMPTNRRIREASQSLGRRAITGEATPMYLFHPDVPERAARLHPDAKLIVTLRHPSRRAWSHYKHSVRLGLETESFSRALALEEDRLAGDDRRTHRGGPETLWPLRDWSYAARGRYTEQLECWLRYFPQEQLLVVFFEDLVSDTEAQLAAIQRFLDLGEPRLRLPWLNSAKRIDDDIEHGVESLALLAQDQRSGIIDLIGRDPGWES